MRTPRDLPRTTVAKTSENHECCKQELGHKERQRKKDLFVKNLVDMSTVL